MKIDLNQQAVIEEQLSEIIEAENLNGKLISVTNREFIFHCMKNLDKNFFIELKNEQLIIGEISPIILKKFKTFYNANPIFSNKETNPIEYLNESYIFNKYNFLVVWQYVTNYRKIDNSKDFSNKKLENTYERLLHEAKETNNINQSSFSLNNILFIIFVVLAILGLISLFN